MLGGKARLPRRSSGLPPTTAAPGLRRAEFWRLPRLPLALILLTELAALVLIPAALVVARWTPATVTQIALLAGLAVFFAECAAPGTRLARFLTSGSAFVDLGSVWAFALALTVPAGPAAATLAILHLYCDVRARGRESVRPYRLLFVTATMALSTLAASAIVHAVADHLTMLPHGAAYAIGVIAAVVGFEIVDQTLVGSVIYLVAKPPTLREVLPDRQERQLETVLIIIGVLTAQCVQVEPWLAPSVLAVIALVYRGSLVHQLQLAATTDTKTSLLNAAGWRKAAAAQLQQSRRTKTAIALLLIDLDHFKRINDTYGHLAGDRALASVGECLRDELRTNDAVGRFGGEEFIVLLSSIDRAGAEAIAERVRAAITRCASDGNMVVTASVGLAHADDPRVELDALIEAADSALYVAKAAGRDRVSARSHSL